MMFTSQLGSVEKYPADAAVKRIANHLRKLQEELEYRLSHLDSTNISEIDADETTITGGIVSLVSQSVGEIAALKLTGQQLEATVEGLGERLASLVLTADSIRLTVEQQSGQLSALEQTAGGITATVQAQGQSIDGLRQTADGLSDTVAQQLLSISTLQQTAGSITATVQAQGQSISTLRQSAEGLTARVESAEGAYTALSQTVSALSAGVSGLEGNYARLQLTLDGFTVETEEGITRIDGGCLQAGSCIAAPIIEGGEIRGSSITGSEIYGGMFSDLDAENYMTVWTSEYPDIPMVSHLMAHYVGDASSSVPLTAMGWVYVGGETPQWMLMVLGSTVLTSQYASGLGNVVRPKGLWDFSGATVIGL